MNIVDHFADQLPAGFHVYGNDWLVQVWRPSTKQEKEAGGPSQQCFWAYYALPPHGVPAKVYDGWEQALQAAIDMAKAGLDERR